MDVTNKVVTSTTWAGLPIDPIQYQKFLAWQQQQLQQQGQTQQEVQQQQQVQPELVLQQEQQQELVQQVNKRKIRTSKKRKVDSKTDTEQEDEKPKTPKTPKTKTPKKIKKT